MTAQPRTLTFCWWNLHNFAHYDAASSSKKRRWRSQADYDAQKRRFHDTFKQIFPGDSPDLLAFCEVTREAAKELAVELPGGFDLTVAAEYPHDDGFQVAVFCKRGMGFSNETPLFPSDRAKIAKGTRPMIPVHLTLPGHEIRFVACLTPNPPLIDEGNTGVVCTPLMLGDDRRPQPFVPNSTCGMSDHLPIVGRLILPENPK